MIFTVAAFAVLFVLLAAAFMGDDDDDLTYS